MLTLLTLGMSLFAADSSFKPKPFDWPQWQGPDRTAAAVETGLLQEWPKDGPPLAWQIKGLGEGFSTPTVAAGRIFSMGNLDKTEFVTAFAEDGGKPLWTHEVGPVRADGGGYHGPRCSPTVDGDLVYALGLNGDLLCLKAATGDEVWRKDLIKDFGGAAAAGATPSRRSSTATSCSARPAARTTTLVALNKKTGEMIWKCPVPDGDGAAYSSIIAVDVDGKRQYVQFLGGGVVGVSEDGKFLWRYNHPANGTANCSTPLFSDDCVFAASAYGTGGGLVRIQTRRRQVQGRGGVLHQAHAEPPRRHGAARRLPVRRRRGPARPASTSRPATCAWADRQDRQRLRLLRRQPPLLPQRGRPDHPGRSQPLRSTSNTAASRRRTRPTSRSGRTRSSPTANSTSAIRICCFATT